MVLTSDYNETVQARIRRDPEFGRLLLSGVVECLFAEEVGVARIRLRNYIVATVGFEQLGTLMGRPAESLALMLGTQGAPSAGDLLEVVACTLCHQGLALQVSTVSTERGGEHPPESWPTSRKAETST